MTMMDVGPFIIPDFDGEIYQCSQLAKEYLGDRGKLRQHGWQCGQKGNDLTNAKGVGNYLLCLCLKICKLKCHSEYRKHEGIIVKLGDMLGRHYRN